MKKIIFFGILFSMLASCGPTVRVLVKGTEDGVTVSTTQSSSDSTSLNINVNPNIQFK